MKTLYSHLNEGILDNIDDQVKGLDSTAMIRSLFEDYVYRNVYNDKVDQEVIDNIVIDPDKKIIDLSKTNKWYDVDTVTVTAKDANKPFPGFPKGYKIIGHKGEEICIFHFFGHIDSISGIPTNNPKLDILMSGTRGMGAVESGSISKQVEKEFGDIKKAKRIQVGLSDQNLDLSNITCRLMSMFVGGVNTRVTFNENTKTNLLMLHYAATPTNLPIFTTLSWGAPYSKMIDDISKMSSTGKSNFDKIKFQNKDLTDPQKEQIRAALKGEKINADNVVDPDIIFNDLKSIYKGFNNSDSTKDYYGQPLNTGI